MSAIERVLSVSLAGRFRFRFVNNLGGSTMTKSNSVLAISGLVLATAAFVPADAQVRIQRNFITTPTGVCQGALPAFETAIRKRPLAMQNEGASTAFVTCAFTGQGFFSGNDSNPIQVTVYFNSSSGAATTVNCTGVSGFQNGPNQFITKSVNLPASGEQGFIAWRASDFVSGSPTLFPSGYFSISCALPTGAAVNDSVVFFSEDIGD